MVENLCLHCRLPFHVEVIIAKRSTEVSLCCYFCHHKTVFTFPSATTTGQLFYRGFSSMTVTKSDTGRKIYKIKDFWEGLLNNLAPSNKTAAQEIHKLILLIYFIFCLRNRVYKHIHHENDLQYKTSGTETCSRESV